MFLNTYNRFNGHERSCACVECEDLSEDYSRDELYVTGQEYNEIRIYELKEKIRLLNRELNRFKKAVAA